MKTAHVLMRFFSMLFLFGFVSQCHRSEKPSENAAASHRPIRIQTAVVETQSVPKEIVVTGTLEPDQHTRLAANADGRVIEAPIERGQRVEKNAVLMRLDVRTAQLTQEEAAANLENLQSEAQVIKRDCERTEILFKKGAISQQAYDKAKGGCIEIEAQTRALSKRLGQAAQRVSDATIRAPYAGLVTERLVNVGAYVHAATAVVALAVTDPLRLTLSVPEAYAMQLKPGVTVRFAPTVAPKSEFVGTVRYLSGEVRQTTRDTLIEAVVENPNGTLLPGMFVKAFLPVDNDTRPTVLASAVVHQDGHDYVYKVVDQHLEQRLVRLGRQFDDKFSIEQGLEPRDVVVMHADPNFRDGAPVQTD